MPETIAKVSEIRKKLDALRSSAWLEVDGGIDVETLPKMKAAGATAFVAATAIFKHPQGAKAGVASLRAVLNHRDTESRRV
jgi:ribulose-phosphate 3-epimerase